MGSPSMPGRSRHRLSVSAHVRHGSRDSSKTLTSTRTVISRGSTPGDETHDHESTAPERVGRLCTLWVHDDTFSRDEIILNTALFPSQFLDIGGLAAIVPVKSDVNVRDFQDEAQDVSSDDAARAKPRRTAQKGSQSLRTKKSSSAVKIHGTTESFAKWNGQDIDPSKRYVFRVKEMSNDQRSKQPTLQISLASHIAQVFGFKNRTQVMISMVDEALNTASHVELAFRDEYLARSDMWRLAMSELGHKTVYRGQKILFMGTIKAQVKHIYVRGQRAQSACFSANTRPVFRSESARYVLFVQMSSEMWDFDSDASGEIMFNKVINGFLPELFKRWMSMNARHLVSIVLFTRVEYEKPLTTSLGTDPQAGRDDQAGRTTSEKKLHHDFYRVVVSEMTSDDWMSILYQLKKEFKVFRRDISIQKTPLVPTGGTHGDVVESKQVTAPEALLMGQPSAAIHGNILEAINLASSQFAADYIDRDLVRTGISIVVITPSAGLFEVDYKMLRTTTETLVNNGIGIDVVCLTKMPLHSVPLFKYRNPAFTTAKSGSGFYRPASGNTTPRQAHSTIGSYSSLRANHSPSKYSATDGSPKGSAVPSRTNAEWCYAIPHWIDVSFWAGPSEVRSGRSDRDDGQGQMVRSGRPSSSGFVPRVKMYELQMMGIMENEMSNISIPYLHQSPFYPKHHHKPAVAKPTIAETNGSDQANALPDTPFFRPTKVLTASFFSKTEGVRPISKADKDPYRWMDVYDENVFHPLKDVRAAEREAKVGKTSADDHSRDADALLFGTSYNESNRSPVGSHVRAGTAYFDRKMKERQEKADQRAEKKMNNAAMNRTMKPVRSSRQFSSGLRFLGMAAPKALPSTELRTEHAKPGPVLRSISGMNSFQSPRSSNSYSSPRPSTRDTDLESIQSDQSSDTRDSLDSLPMPMLNPPVAESPSRPIAIRGKTALLEENQAVKSKTNVASPFDAFAHDVRQSERIDVLQAASKTKQAGPRFDPSGSVPKLMMTLSPTSALAPWLTLLNPSNPRKHNSDIDNEFGRWQHVFPRPIRTSAMKWKSLCSPASVPLTTEVFPTAAQLASEYQENPYNISQNDDEEPSEDTKTRDSLMKELIALRLSQGFQIVVGPAVSEALGHMSLNIADLFDSAHIGEDGALIVLSMGNTIHQLQCIEGGEVEVKRFVRKSTREAEASALAPDEPNVYTASIRTYLAETYEPRRVIFQPPREEQNWNYVDSFIAGYEEQFTEHLRFWRARFVLIPIDHAAGPRRQLHALNEDNEEEVRLEGIRKLTQMWQRHRVSQDERHVPANRANRQRKDTNPLDIVYQTRDPSAVIAAELDSLPLLETDTTGSGARSHLFSSETETFSRSNFKLATLAQEIQGEKGIAMQDRRWHFRVHPNCFIGFEMTSWLLVNFRDVNTREEAVELGNELMTAGLVQHVEKRHQFRDGNFFYQIASEHRAIRPESRRGWFGGSSTAGGSIRRSDRSMPSTPLTGPVGGSPRTDPSRQNSTDPTLESSTTDSPDATTPTAHTPNTTSSKRLKIALSKSMRYDVDHRKRSYRPEHINLHYDRLHNPDNCYHIRIDWMNVTAKLIEDAIVLWATTAEKSGLRLVEVPIGEASSITEVQPFRAPYIITLAVPPPPRPSLSNHGGDRGSASSASFSPHLPTAATPTQKHPYHHLLLRRFNFVLDIEAASNFPSDVDVTYSWGQPSYRYTQYIHRSGVLLAQITDEGHLLLLANRLCNDRTAAGTNPNLAASVEKSEHRDRRSAGGAGTSPFSSPLVRAALDPSAGNGNGNGSGGSGSERTPDEIKQELEAFCADKALLSRFYEEMGRVGSASASPGAEKAMEEGSIPALGLPPSLRGIGLGVGGRSAEGGGSPRGSVGDRSF